MNANPILLQKKYARIIQLFANNAEVTIDEALGFFYSSVVYQLMKEGVSDIHCRSDEYLAEELYNEYII